MGRDRCGQSNEVSAMPLAVPTEATTSCSDSGEQTRQALPEQHQVLGDHQSHGSTACTVVPAAGALVTVSVPPIDPLDSVALSRWSPCAGTCGTTCPTATSKSCL